MTTLMFWTPSASWFVVSLLNEECVRPKYDQDFAQKVLLAAQGSDCFYWQLDGTVSLCISTHYAVGVMQHVNLFISWNQDTLLTDSSNCTDEHC
jgi:myosin heavy subunit